MTSSTREQDSIFVDHYAALGLERSASLESIRRAFRRMAKLTHPDRAGGDGLLFLGVYTAYRLLSDTEARHCYDEQVLRHRCAAPPLRDRVIPPTRLVYPTSVAALARRGLMRRSLRGKARKYVLSLNYDLELPLSRSEVEGPIAVAIPLIARTLCPDCRASDVHCPACGGRGWHKNSRNVRLRFDGGLAHGQILEIPLSGLRPGSLGHFKKRRLRIKISVRNPARASAPA